MGDKWLITVALVVARRLAPVLLGAVIAAIAAAGLLDGQAADACRAALGL